MSGNLENDRSVTSSKMYPIDLAPQKMTIVKSGSSTEVKMAHLIPGQPKTSSSSQLITHANAGTGLLRPGIAQIISPSVASQPQIIVSGPPILQGTQIVSQGSQIIGPSTQIISQSQLITATGQILSPATQIISQGTQLSAQVSNASNVSAGNQVGVVSSSSGTQVMSVGGQLVSGAGNLVVNSTVRTLPPTVRVLPPLPHHNTRPALLSNVNVSNAGSVLVSKGVSVGVTSHVPRGLAAGASLAVRPVAPASSTQPGTQGSGWANNGRGGRGALVYGARAATPRVSTPVSPAVPLPTPHSAVVTLPTTSVLNSSGVVAGVGRGTTGIPAPRPLPLLQRNFQPAKVVGVASVGVRGVVGNSAPTQLYYEVPRATHAPQHAHATHAPLATLTTLATHAPLATLTTLATHAPHAALTTLATHTPHQQAVPRPLTPYAHATPHQHSTQVSVVNTVPVSPDSRSSPAASIASTQIQPRPSILRKRDIDGSPSKLVGGVGLGNLGILSSVNVMGPRVESTGAGTGWEDVPAGGGRCGASGGSTTISASSSPAPDDEPDLPRLDPDLSPRKKPRKQILSIDVRQCEYQPEEPQRAPSPVSFTPPPKRPLLSSSYVCGWRGTALHFVRPADVRRREPRARDILAIAAQRHVLTSAEGWKVHHLTAQMDDLVSLESDVGDQLADVLKVMENASGRALTALQPHTHTLLELLKGNIQRSKIVCEGIQEAREDILRVFTHRNFVSDILTRQADKRCFRKHRSQS